MYVIKTWFSAPLVGHVCQKNVWIYFVWNAWRKELPKVITGSKCVDQKDQEDQEVLALV